jgi:hypothetical protein
MVRSASQARLFLYRRVQDRYYRWGRAHSLLHAVAPPLQVALRSAPSEADARLLEVLARRVRLTADYSRAAADASSAAAGTAQAPASVAAVPCKVHVTPHAAKRCATVAVVVPADLPPGSVVTLRQLAFAGSPDAFPGHFPATVTVSGVACSLRAPVTFEVGRAGRE